MSGLPEVVRATVRGMPDVVAVGKSTGFWVTPEPVRRGIHSFYHHADADVTDRRPLVLIDPEDAEQVAAFVQRLIAESRDPGLSAYLPHLPYAAVKAALRSLAMPDAPEQMGCGALVIAKESPKGYPNPWARTSTGKWIRLNDNYGKSKPTAWGDLIVVDVIHNGYQGSGSE